MAAKRTPRPRATPKVLEGDDAMVLVESGAVEWRIAAVDYRLRKLKWGEWKDLREQWFENKRKVARANQIGLAMPFSTFDEQDAKADTLQAARELGYELSTKWWGSLFAACCTTIPQAPDAADLPGWASDMGTQDAVLTHMVGPFPSGPLPPPATT